MSLCRAFLILTAGACLAVPVAAQSRKAPDGMFRDLDDEIVGKALLIQGKQLFIDDHVIEELKNAKKVLNRPVKHASNPLLRRDKDKEFAITYGAVVHDKADGLFKMWYSIAHDAKDEACSAGYAVSKDGITWDKPIDKATGTNRLVFDPPESWVGAPGILIDDREKDPQRRFKMTYLAKPTGKASSLRSCIAYSGDGVHWKQEPQNPVMPYSDTQICPHWDARLGRFVAYLRFGPPNIRIISRTESEDFVHWSPKATVIRRSKLDEPFNTELYTMAALPYEGIHIGLLNTYHGETIKPIPPDQPWMDRVDVQLAFSRNGVTWQRVGKAGAIANKELRGERDWKQTAQDAVFLPYGEFRKDWDWGQIYPFHPPLVVGDEIRFYYTGISGRHWRTYHKDTPDYAVGLATLRLDGFVSVDADKEGTLTTRPLVFLGDTLVVNANAAGGSLVVEALDGEGKPIPGFRAEDCKPITSDGVRHVVTWKSGTDCHLLQARPIKLRFHLNNARLYAFEPRIRHKHYLQSYD